MTTNTNTPDTTRFVDPPEGWSTTADDLSETPYVDIIGRTGPTSFVDVMEPENGLYSVALNAGLYGNVAPDDYDWLKVSRGHVQYAVETLAERAPE